MSHTTDLLVAIVYAINAFILPPTSIYPGCKIPCGALTVDIHHCYSPIISWYYKLLFCANEACKHSSAVSMESTDGNKGYNTWQQKHLDRCRSHIELMRKCRIEIKCLSTRRALLRGRYILCVRLVTLSDLIVLSHAMWQHGSRESLLPFISYWRPQMNNC